MVEHLDATQSLDAPRKMRFPEQFIDDVTTLVATITSDIISRHNKDAKVIYSSCKSKLFTYRMCILDLGCLNTRVEAPKYQAILK
jgi:hypothetical protein